jgi:hypothetical protein
LTGTKRIETRLGIVAAVLLALAVWLDEMRAHQSRCVAELGYLAGPIVRTSTGFHTHHAWLQPRQERQQLLAGELSSQHHRSSGINPMKPEDALCQIDAERCNLHLEISSLLLAVGQMYHQA